MSRLSIALSCLLAVATVAAAPAPVQADEVCIAKSGQARAIRVRRACRPNEKALGSLDALERLLGALSTVDDGATLRLSAVNLQIVSGSGRTAGDTNGRGNLIVGYNEPFDDDAEFERLGSHNVVIGPNHAYPSYGGLVAGFENKVLGPYTSVTGGFGSYARGRFATVAGGSENVAEGDWSVVSGGEEGFAFGKAAVVAGGFNNFARGDLSAVCGGRTNEATGVAASVSGGKDRSAAGDDSWAAGSLLEPD